MKYLIVIMLLLCAGWLDPLADARSEGNKLYAEGKYAEAEAAYKRAAGFADDTDEKAAVAYSRGAAVYMQGQYEQAADFFRQGIDSSDREIQTRSLFALGNALYRSKDYAGAVESWINTLKLDPQHEGARKNLEYLLKNQQNQQNQNDNQDKKDSDQNSDKNDNENNQQNNQDNNQQNKENRNDNQDQNGQQNQDGNKSRQQNSNQQQGDERKSSGKLDAEQIEAMLRAMQNKPVRREGGYREGEVVDDNGGW